MEEDEETIDEGSQYFLECERCESGRFEFLYVQENEMTFRCLGCGRNIWIPYYENKSVFIIGEQR